MARRLLPFLTGAFSVAAATAGFAFGVFENPTPSARVAQVQETPIAIPLPPREMVAAPQPSNESLKSSELSVVFMGDVMLDRTVAARSRAAQSLRYPFEHIRASELFTGDDVRVVNLEGPVTPTRRDPVKSIDFAFDPAVVAVLHDLGVTAASQANNHTLDQGRAGAEDSRRALTKGDIAVFGDQVRDDAKSALTVIEQRGARIALVGFNTTDNPLDYAAAEATLTEARLRADIVFAFMHWGQEYRATPTADQTALAEWLIDHGVDVVIGGHPHWMESVAVYKGHPIIYSLGNFVFDQDWSPETQQGLAVRVRLQGSAGKVELIPVGVVASQPVVLTGEARQVRLDRLASVSDAKLAADIHRGVLPFAW